MPVNVTRERLFHRWKPRLDLTPRARACATQLKRKAALVHEELAKQLTSPVADLISFPIPSRHDVNVGPNDGWRSTTNVQPVIPIHPNDDWSLISRTLVPINYPKEVIQ